MGMTLELGRGVTRSACPTVQQRGANRLQRTGVRGCGSCGGWCNPGGSSLVDNGKGMKTQHPPSALRGAVLAGRCGFRSAGIMETLCLLLLPSQKARHIRPARNATFRTEKAQATLVR